MAGYDFHHNLKILSLSSYDLTLGMDWLELYNPMMVPWGAKWMSIPIQGEQILLQGIPPTDNSDLVFQLLTVEVQSTADLPEALSPDISSTLLKHIQLSF